MYEKIFRKRSLEILEALLSGPLTLSELSVTLKISKPTLQQKYLKDMEDIGIITKSALISGIGREVSYSLEPLSFHFSLRPSNSTCLTFASRKELFDVPFLLHQIVPEDIRDDIMGLLEEIELSSKESRPSMMILYGSAAEGRSSRKSDIDLLVLRREWTSMDRDSFMDLLAKVSFNMDHKLSPLFVTEEEFEKGSSPIIEEIKDKGMMVYVGGDKEGRLWGHLKRYRSISI